MSERDGMETIATVYAWVASRNFPALNVFPWAFKSSHNGILRAARICSEGKRALWDKAFVNEGSEVGFPAT